MGFQNIGSYSYRTYLEPSCNKAIARRILLRRDMMTSRRMASTRARMMPKTNQVSGCAT